MANNILGKKPLERNGTMKKLEQEIIFRLENELGDVASKYKKIVESVAKLSGSLVLRGIAGENVSYTVQILEATMLNLASASQAITVRAIKKIVKEVAGLALKITLEALA